MRVSFRSTNFVLAVCAKCWCDAPSDMPVFAGLFKKVLIQCLEDIVIVTYIGVATAIAAAVRRQGINVFMLNRLMMNLSSDSLTSLQDAEIL